MRGAAVLSLLPDRRIEVQQARGAERGESTEAEEMTREAFSRLVEEALQDIPRRFREEIKNVAIVVEDEPSPQLMAEMEIEPPDSLYGLYQGTPLPERSWTHGNALPDRVTLFQRTIEEDAEDLEDMIVSIAETLIHELGHYFGMSEEQIEEIEDKYWNGESVEDL